MKRERTSGDSLTVRQLAILVGIDAFTERHGYPPTVRELAGMVGLKSASTMHGHLERLQARGLVTWDPSKPRTLTRAKECVLA